MKFDLPAVLALAWCAVALVVVVVCARQELRAWREDCRILDEALGISSEEHRE